MEDVLEGSNEPGFDRAMLLGMVRRRHMYILIPLFFGWLAVWGASWILPATYKSETTILVEEPDVPRDYVTPNVNDDLQARLQSITQQILSRTRLVRIIEQKDLYAKERQHQSPDELVERMRKDIAIELVTTPGTLKLSSFNVSFTARDPYVAQKVTSELTNLFISENLEVRQQESEGTTKFLESQLEDARKTLADQEEKISAFKGQHVNDLPGQVQSNLQILAGLQGQLQTQEENLNRAKQQNVYFQSLLAQYRSLQQTPKGVDGAPALGLPAIDAELDKLKAQLADLSSHYTDKHPDVRKVKEQIAKTERLRQQLLAAPKSSEGSGTESAGAQQYAGGTPAAELQSQLKANQAEIASRERSVVALQAQINQYQGRLSEGPVREQQLADLSRGYEQSKANYDDLLKKKNSSQMATSLELLQRGEHFRVLDPPSLPTQPNFPKRLLMSGAGLGVGLFLGIVVAGLELTDGRLYSEAQIKAMLPVEIIAEIPPLADVVEQKREQQRLWVGWATAGFVLVAILAGTAFSFLRG